MGGASKEGHSGFGLFVLKTLTSAIMLIRLERLAIDVIEHFDFFIFYLFFGLLIKISRLKFHIYKLKISYYINLTKNNNLGTDSIDSNLLHHIKGLHVLCARKELCEKPRHRTW